MAQTVYVGDTHQQSAEMRAFFHTATPVTMSVQLHRETAFGVLGKVHHRLTHNSLHFKSSTMEFVLEIAGRSGHGSSLRVGYAR